MSVRPNRQRFFDSNHRRLVYVDSRADSEFWDQQWATHNLEALLSAPPLSHYNREILQTTRRYLEAGSRILEGGCGLGDKVALLTQHGFETWGVDFAKQTVERANTAAPDLKITVGDVRHLDFDDSTFDGYWSLGVIEHFFEGYGQIRQEMFRVLRPGGFLFLSFPALSRLRALKGKLGILRPWREEDDLARRFYQFALDPSHVADDFERHGFTLRQRRNWSGFEGFEDEVPLASLPLKVLYRLAYRPTEGILRAFANHASLLVLEKSYG